MQLAFLTALHDRPGPWASVYLDTSRMDESARWRQELMAREACDELAAQGCDEATVRAVHETLSAWPRPAGEAGRAVFAAHGEVVLDPPLAVRPPAPSRVFWSALPRLGPLLDLAAGEPVCLVAYIDRMGADLELRGPIGAATPAGEVRGRDWPVHRTATNAWSERHFQLSVENTWEENAQKVADAVADAVPELGVDVVVLAGGERERRSVHERLPVALAAEVVESGHGGRAAGSGRERLDEDVRAAKEAFLRRRAEAELDRFRAARAPEGASAAGAAAAEGVPALVEAAREHRIAELLIRPEGPDAHRRVWVGARPDQVAVRRSETQYLGDTEPLPARADDALLRSALAAGAEVLRVRPEVDDEVPVGGLGALLRWPYDENETEAATM
ncbi:Vms1/Ankzf1 family peptidyl-tRNA hydrolase [Streptomyces fradiae]|uniref:baeRF2 domain-containing protein n=1 Tax=Streptomyces fradiae TaxID=1906 RepID=UPI0035BE94A2